MGGCLIFCSGQGDLNLNVILEILIDGGCKLVLVQKFIFDIIVGDKCILLVDGELVDYCLVCIFQGDEFRGNLVVGGCGEGCLLSECDCWIIGQVGLEMKCCGMCFVGLDVIGDYLIEVNVISLICVCEFDVQYGLNIVGILFDVFEVGLC